MESVHYFYPLFLNYKIFHFSFSFPSSDQRLRWKDTQVVSGRSKFPGRPIISSAAQITPAWLKAATWRWDVGRWIWRPTRASDSYTDRDIRASVMWVKRSSPPQQLNPTRPPPHSHLYAESPPYPHPARLRSTVLWHFFDNFLSILLRLKLQIEKRLKVSAPAAQRAKKITVSHWKVKKIWLSSTEADTSSSFCFFSKMPLLKCCLTECGTER